MRRFLLAAALVLGLGMAVLWIGHALPAAPLFARLERLRDEWIGLNPHPVHLLRPKGAPLSALARLGQRIFFDPALSASATQSCATCHDPQHAYGPPNRQPVQPGGADSKAVGFRATPSLTYLYRQLAFSIGPEAADTEQIIDLQHQALQGSTRLRAQKSAGLSPTEAAVVPQGGLFWDGRANTLQAQALGPLLNPLEMANANLEEVAQKLARAPYRDLFVPLFGKDIFAQPERLVAEALSAVARFQIEDASFHRFNSRYDAWLEGRERFSRSEMRGLQVFNNARGANCAGCHPSEPSPEGLPPLFTDSQYEALGVPRNLALPANRDPQFFDLGLCGPLRFDLRSQRQYCGMFVTPSLRNVALRPVYFHNGVYRSLRQVITFYNLRDLQPEQIYPPASSGLPALYNDMPAALADNIDHLDAPFDRRPGDAPSMSPGEIDDLIAFLNTLSDQAPVGQP